MTVCTWLVCHKMKRSVALKSEKSKDSASLFHHWDCKVQKIPIVLSLLSKKPHYYSTVMAKFIKETLEVDLTSINPTLIVRCDLEYFPNWEAPVSLSGEFRLANGKKAANLIWNRIDDHFVGDLTFPDEEIRKEYHSNPKYKSPIGMSLSAELSPLVVDQIEKLREADHENSAKFSVYLSYSTLRSETLKRNGEGKPNLLLRHENQTLNFAIKQSEWLNKFAEPLGIGKFLVVELRMLNQDDVPETWKEVFNRTQEQLVEMERCIKRGAWQEAMVCGRRAFEAMKVFDDKPENAVLKAEFDAALVASNHEADSIRDLDKGIKGMYHFASKYLHERGLSGILKPNPIATSADAYLMYSLCINIINMVGSKLHLLTLMTPRP